MLVIWGADVDGVDVVPLDELSPVSLVAGVAPLVGKCLGAVLRAAADCLQDGRVPKIGEEVADALVAVGVGAAHEAVADETDSEFLFL